jgi:hypothetical protein
VTDRPRRINVVTTEMGELRHNHLPDKIGAAKLVEAFKTLF